MRVYINGSSRRFRGIRAVVECEACVGERYFEELDRHGHKHTVPCQDCGAAGENVVTISISDLVGLINEYNSEED